MIEPQKKIIPKFKKKLQGFLSDESGKITKEDVLKIGMVAMGVAGMSSGVGTVIAGHSDAYYNLPAANSHANGQGGNCYGSGPWASSNVVNGHANASGIAGGTCFGGTSGHGNTSHGSHSSHGSCCGGSW